MIFLIWDDKRGLWTWFVSLLILLILLKNLNFSFISSKVTDFGLSNKRDTVGTDSMFEDYCGTPLYMGKLFIYFNLV